MNSTPLTHPIFRTGARSGLIQISRLGTLCCKAHQHGHRGWKDALRDALKRVANYEPVFDHCMAHGSMSLDADAALAARTLLQSNAFELKGTITFAFDVHPNGGMPQTPMGRGLMALLAAQLVLVDLLSDGTLRVRPNRRNWHYDRDSELSWTQGALRSFAVTDIS